MAKTGNGFSLVEVLVVLTLAGILFSISGPSLGKFYQLYSTKNSRQVLQAAFGEAFSQSRSYNETLTLKAEKGANTFEYDNEKRSLFGQTVFNESFELTFTPPFGDIKGSSSEHITLKNKEKLINFRIYHSSGLITRAPIKEVISQSLNLNEK